MVFFGIWWAWMNVTWFASAYDSNDVQWRISIFVVIAGALVLAAGVPQAFTDHDFLVVVIGYCIMRTSLVLLWLRAAHDDPAHGPTARAMALGITLCQLGWVALLFVPQALVHPLFGLLVVAELLVPVLGERRGRTPWHPGHIAERYSLFTLIVLGESVLSGSVALGAAVGPDGHLDDVWGIALGGLLLVFSMWWKYFARSAEDLLTTQPPGVHLGLRPSRRLRLRGRGRRRHRRGGRPGDRRRADISQRARRRLRHGARPSIYVVTVYWLHLRPQEDAQGRGFTLLGVPLLLLATFAPQPVLVAGLCAAGDGRGATSSSTPGTSGSESGEAEVGVEADGEAGVRGDAAHAEQHARGERRHVEAVVAEGQGLPRAAEQHLLVRDEPAQRAPSAPGTPSTWAPRAPSRLCVVASGIGAQPAARRASAMRSRGGGGRARRGVDLVAGGAARRSRPTRRTARPARRSAS